MLPTALLLGAIAMIAHGWWRGRSMAAWIAGAVRGQSASRPRSTLGWALGIGVMYGATAIIALALIGRLDTLFALPRELRAAATALSITPIGVDELRDMGVAIVAGFALGGLLVAVSARRGWRTFGPAYRSPAIARTRGETGAALILSAAAGIGEELFFRLLVPLLGALVFGNGIAGCVLGWALFTLAHRYQGRGGMAAVGLVGAVLGWLYLATGQLWLVMALHMIVDANSLIVRPWLERAIPRNRP